MKQVIKTSLIMFVIFTFLTGIVYPFAVWAVGRVIFPHQANGSLVKKGAEVKGSILIAQAFEKPGYFHPRLSAVSYDASASGGSNIAASNPDFAKMVFERADKEKKMNPSAGPIPLELLTTSSSGLDPEITVKAAEWQAKRVADARGMDEKKVLEAVYRLKEGALFGFIGPDRVNVLKLNMYLDSASGK